MQRIMSITFGAAAAMLALASGIACTTIAQSTANTAAPPSVPVVAAQHRDLPLEASYTGRVEAVHTVELRPRVTGLLERVLFAEGTHVDRGTPLFKIDARPFAIALRRAEADAATVQAQLTRAREEFQRAERLALSDAVAIEELERRRAEVGVLEGKLEAATAAMADASLNLEFTTVTAPVSGRVGRAEVTEGNLVNGGSGSGTRLAVLRSTDPTYVYFELDPQTAAAAAAHRRQDWLASVSPTDGSAAVDGPVDFVDNGVGQQTGTLRVRARLRNGSGRLIPGSVVKVTFRYGQAQQATIVPEIAINTDQGSRFVLVAGERGQVQYRAVQLGARTDGGWRVVNDGVRPGEQVILPGLPGLRAGMTVAPVQEVQR